MTTEHPESDPKQDNAAGAHVVSSSGAPQGVAHPQGAAPEGAAPEGAAPEGAAPDGGNLLEPDQA